MSPDNGCNYWCFYHMHLNQIKGKMAGKKTLTDLYISHLPPGFRSSGVVTKTYIVLENPPIINHEL